MKAIGKCDIYYNEFVKIALSFYFNLEIICEIIIKHILKTLMLGFISHY